MIIKMDGRQYNVGAISGTLEESFRVSDGPNTDTLITGEEVRDVIGTYYDHSLQIEPDMEHYQDYLDFYHDISAPVASHTITFPHEGGEITYEAMVYSGAHSIVNAFMGMRVYTGLTVIFKAKAPQREAV